MGRSDVREFLSSWYLVLQQQFYFLYSNVTLNFTSETVSILLQFVVSSTSG